MYENGRVTGVRPSARDGGQERTVTADHYVRVLPVEHARVTWGRAFRAADPQLARRDALQTATLTDADRLGWFMDPAVTGLGGSDPQNREQLLVHPTGSLYNRPSARTNVPNFFLAGDWACPADQVTGNRRRLMNADGRARPRICGMIRRTGLRSAPMSTWQPLHPQWVGEAPTNPRVTPSTHSWTRAIRRIIRTPSGARSGSCIGPRRRSQGVSRKGPLPPRAVSRCRRNTWLC
nr:hypothetical protein [Kutzneria buriramensis]WKX11630.1 hypothetical protein Q4V64_30610 [Kutzneria buriramensis]